LAAKCAGFSIAKCEVGDMGVKAPDMKCVLVQRKAPCERRRRKHLRGFGGMPPQEIFKIEHSETPFPSFLWQGWRSLKFSLKSKILNENGQ